MTSQDSTTLTEKNILLDAKLRRLEKITSLIEDEWNFLIQSKELAESREEESFWRIEIIKAVEWFEMGRKKSEKLREDVNAMIAMIKDMESDHD